MNCCPHRPNAFVACGLALAALAISGCSATDGIGPSPTSASNPPRVASGTSGVPVSAPPESTTLFGDKSVLTVEAVYIAVCGPTEPTDESCPREKLVGLEITLRSVSGEVVTVESTNERGVAKFVVAPGDYIVEGADDDRAITPTPQQVTLMTDSPTALTMTYPSAFQ